MPRTPAPGSAVKPSAGGQAAQPGRGFPGDGLADGVLGGVLDRAGPAQRVLAGLVPGGGDDLGARS